MGFFAVVGALTMYSIGIVTAIIWDISPTKKLKQKLMKDFRNIDRYGLNMEEDDRRMI